MKTAPTPMGTASTHVLAEYLGCPAGPLDDPAFVEAAMRRAAEAAEATVVQVALHRFSPQGVSGVVVLEESHLSVHTWPEQGYAAVDFFTCGDCHPERGQAALAEALGAARVESMVIARGGPPAGPMMRVVRHRVDEEARATPEHGPAGPGAAPGGP